MNWIKKILGWLAFWKDKKDEVIPKPDPKPEPVIPDDVEFLATVKWLGSNYSKATRQEILVSAIMSGDKIFTQYKLYSWPVKDGVKPVDAICCLFYVRDGEWTGGKFDWWRKGGQSTKGLENVINGYGGHSMPESGIPVKTMIVSVDGKMRSNCIDVTRK